MRFVLLLISTQNLKRGVRYSKKEIGNGLPLHSMNINSEGMSQRNIGDDVG